VEYRIENVGGGRQPARERARNHALKAGDKRHAEYLPLPQKRRWARAKLPKKTWGTPPWPDDLQYGRSRSLTILEKISFR
jgi:hypothetical protein